MKKTITGFTIVELLIVIVVIAILATISVVAYNGIQQRARDSQRKADLAAIVKALELYRADNGNYPPAPSGGWCTQLSNPARTQVMNALKPYMNTVPSDPLYRGTFQDYFYKNFAGSSYALYAQMEAADNGSYPTTGCITIDNTPNTYNYAYGK